MVNSVRQLRLMSAPSCEAVSRNGTYVCCICGRPASSKHHIVPRSQGGTDGPTITVCGRDNVTGCHGDLHQHNLFLDYVDGEWRFAYVAEGDWVDAGVPVGRRTVENVPGAKAWRRCIEGEV